MKKVALACSLLMIVLSWSSAYADAGEDLLKAAGNGKQEKVQRLLAKGVDVGARDGSGRTALHRAAEGGHAQVVALLLKNGADVDAKDGEGQTPLHLAAQAGDLEVLALLRDAGGSMEAADPKGRTPLAQASGKDSLLVLVNWHQAAKADKYFAYKIFLGKHPDSGYAEQARAKVAYLYDHECTSRTRVRPGPGRQVIEYLAPSGKPCGKTEVRKGPPATAKRSKADTARARPKPGVTVPPAGGIMVIEKDLFDVGEVERGQPIEHTFIVKNTGTGPLTIKAKPG